MKKNIIPFFMLISILFISCNQAAFEKSKAPQGYGTVVIGVDGAEIRAIGENGLPLLNNSEMTIKVTKVDGTLIKEQTFNASAPKTMSLTLPVGEKIDVKITVENISARWTGQKRHEVTSGANTVSVKIKKSAAVLQNLLFGTDKPYSSIPNDYTLTLKIGSTEVVKKEHIGYHSFCRDNRGRTYLTCYNGSGSTWDFERYTSEGTKEEDKTFNLPLSFDKPMLASDHAAGAVYVVAKNGLDMKLYRINEGGGSFTELTGVSIGVPTGYAVYNNVLIASGYGMNGPELKMYRIDGNSFSEITHSASPNLGIDTKITLDAPGHYVHGEIKDLYMTEDSLYVLFSYYEHSAQPFSLGGIVKYSYNPADGTISAPVRIGIKDTHTLDEQTDIFHIDDDEFYGPVTVIGFDEENLYIADDGVQFEFQKGKPRISANKNRIATLKKEDDTLTFAPSEMSWMKEEKKWEGPNTKIIVWKKSNTGHGFDYYQLDSYNTAPATGNSIAASASHDNYFTDVFCFDEAGNLYIAQRQKPNSYVIYRYKLQDNGSYAGSTDTITIDSYDKLVAIAVDISRSVSNEFKNALYYSYDESDRSCIKRFTWGKNAAFSTATADDENFGVGGVFRGPQDDPIDKTKTRFTALAADKNGFFVGETFKNTTTKKYTINVKKYAHTAAGYNRPESTIEVVPETVYYSGTVGNIEFSLSENLNALYIQDGILFGVTAKEFRNDYNSANEPQKASISGRLWEIGKTDAVFTTDTLKRPHSSEPDPWPGDDNGERKEGGKFAPYRFIAVKPKHMVIASDGFYGWVDGVHKKAEQYNRNWQFPLDENGSLDGGFESADVGGAGSDITFSKSLKNNSYFDWEY